MKTEQIQAIREKWAKYFPEQEEPIAAFYADELHGAELAKKPAENPRGYTCMFAQISALHKGQPMAFCLENLGCWGAIGNLFGGPYNEDATVRLLTEIERFKKDRELANDQYYTNPKPTPTGKYFILKPLSTLVEADEPEMFCIFAKPDMIAALHTLVGFDDARPDSVLVPFGSGCEQTFKFALHEAKSDTPRGIIAGMDVAMRGCLRQEIQIFSAPAKLFLRMVGNMDDSFLNTYIWEGLKKRLDKKI